MGHLLEQVHLQQFTAEATGGRGRHLPHTFLNIRLSPVEIVRQTPDEIRRTVRRLVRESGNPYLTGVCCINMDDRATDAQVAAIFEEVGQLRAEHAS